MLAHGRGYTLMEILLTLTVAGILMSVAVPRMDRMIRRERVRSAANRLVADLGYTRMMAMRSGSGAVLRFFPDARCPRGGTGYRVALRGGRGTLRTSTAGPGVLVCYQSNNGDSVIFTSRGLLAPFNNRTIWVAEGNVRDSLTLSVAGRVLLRR